MTVTMRKSGIVLSIGAAVAVIAAACAAPAAAYDAEPVATSAASTAMAWVPPGKSQPKRVRHVRAAPARVASLARPGCGWSTSLCDRPFVLMIGIGF
ncbi:MAG: hypothetical protein U1E61_17545 [Bradyrhizobium sp.]